MFRFVKSISLATQLLVPVFAFILFAPGYFSPEAGDFFRPNEGLVYGFWEYMAGLSSWIPLLLSGVAALVSAMLLSAIDLRNLLMGQRSFAIAFVFLFLLASSGQAYFFHPAFLSGLFVLLSNRFLLELYKTESSYTLTFSTAFYWSLGGMLYPPLLLTVPVLFAGLILMGAPDLRHWLVLLTGLAVPFGLISAVWFLSGNLDYQFSSFVSWFSLREEVIPGFIRANPYIAIWLGLVVFWILVASIGYRNPKIQSRRLFLINFIQFVLLLVTTILIETVKTEIAWLLIIPVSYLLTFWVLDIKKPWKRDLFFITLILSWLFFLLKGPVFGLTG